MEQETEQIEPSEKSKVGNLIYKILVGTLGVVIVFLIGGFAGKERSDGATQQWKADIQVQQTEIKAELAKKIDGKDVESIVTRLTKSDDNISLKIDKLGEKFDTYNETVQQLIGKLGYPGASKIKVKY